MARPPQEVFTFTTDFNTGLPNQISGAGGIVGIPLEITGLGTYLTSFSDKFLYNVDTGGAGTAMTPLTLTIFTRTSAWFPVGDPGWLGWPRGQCLPVQSGHLQCRSGRPVVVLAIVWQHRQQTQLSARRPACCSGYSPIWAMTRRAIPPITSAPTLQNIRIMPARWS